MKYKADPRIVGVRGPRCRTCGGLSSWLIHDEPYGERRGPGIWGGPFTHAYAPNRRNEMAARKGGG